jgi:acetyl esterase
MPLDPRAQAFLDEANAAPSEELSPPELRRQVKPQLLSWEAPLEPVARIDNLAIPGPAGEIPIRVYTPAGQPTGALVYFHGGGWVVCDLDTHEGVCRSLANGAGCVVVSVDYRLAPEHRFPAAVEDSFAATEWAAANLPPGPLAVGGDSAGGNLAAVVAHLARDTGLALAVQLLVYPVTNYEFSTASYRDFGEGYFLDARKMRLFFEHYLREEADGADPRVSLLRAERFAGLPPAVVITAGFDPLRDEGRAYAAKLREAGVPVEHFEWADMFHPFFNMTALFEQAGDARRRAAAALRAAFLR